MITIAIIGSVLSVTSTHFVEVQDQVVIVAEDLANRLIAIENQMVAYIQTSIASPAECCITHYVKRNWGYLATPYIDNVLNWDCPIRGSPA